MWHSLQHICARHTWTHSARQRQYHSQERSPLLQVTRISVFPVTSTPPTVYLPLIWDRSFVSLHILLTYLLTYLLTTWSRVLLEKLTDFHLFKKFSALYVTRRFITAFKSASDLSLFWASSIKSITPHPISCRSIWILSSIYAWVSQEFSFLQVSSSKPCIRLYSPSYALATPPPQLILLDFITRIILGEDYRSLSSSLCSFLHSVVTSPLLGPNILRDTLVSNTLSQRSSPNASDQVSHPCNKQLRCISRGLYSFFLYIISFTDKFRTAM